MDSVFLPQPVRLVGAAQSTSRELGLTNTNKKIYFVYNEIIT